MFVFDLTHDRMASDPVAMVSDVQQAVILDEGRYAQAARKIGLSPREFGLFESRVLLGDVHRTTLPTRIDAMAGMHRGRVYAVRNVRVRAGQIAYVVVLPGKRVYVPVVCGNLSVVHSPRVVRRVLHAAPRRLPRGLVPTSSSLAAVTTVPMQPPQALPVIAPELAPAAPAAAAPLAAGGAHRFFAIPFFTWLAGSIGSVIGESGEGGGGGGAPPLPPCSAGTTSDAGACNL
ncbi:MAG TPA: hypothetical protein VMA36_11410 [Candidatus Limnocylindria bacterium]|jgi:hypothetical protein|nr:hypothetical protein [Candidatus Limnocylindria bacterium]